MLDPYDDWFLIDSELMEKFVIWEQRIPLDLKTMPDFDTEVKKFKTVSLGEK